MQRRLADMRFILLIAALLIALSTPALAQEPPPVEVFAGYSFFGPDGGGSLHGLNVSVAINLHRRIAVVGDFSAHAGSQSLRTDIFDDDFFPGDISIRADSDANVITFLGGPKFSTPPIANGKLTPFAHVLIGVSRLSADATIRFGNATLDTKFADMGFAAAVGGGLDLSLSESVGIRLIQADYLATNYGGTGQRNARLAFGFILR
jgi:hypothetical protein